MFEETPAQSDWSGGGFVWVLLQRTEPDEPHMGFFLHDYKAGALAGDGGGFKRRFALFMAVQAGGAPAVHISGGAG